MAREIVTRRRFVQGATALVGGAALSVADRRPATAQLRGKLAYWHHYTSESEMDGLKTGTEMFQRKHPQLTVESLTVPNADFMAKFTLAVQGGRGKPDTTMIAAERVPDMVGMGGLHDLTERLGRWDMKRHFPEGRFEAARIEGKTYGVPSFMFVDWMYYRTDWFAEKGIKPPTTFAEFFDAAVKLTDPAKGRYGFGMRGGGGGQGLIVQVIRAFG